MVRRDVGDETRLMRHRVTHLCLQRSGHLHVCHARRCCDSNFRAHREHDIYVVLGCNAPADGSVRNDGSQKCNALARNRALVNSDD